MSYARHASALSLGILIVLAAVLGGGCTSPTVEDGPEGAIPIRIGTMPITAALPIYVAEEAGLFGDAGLDATVEVFHSATDRNTAFTADAIDCTQGDPVSLVLLEAGGFPVSATTIILGATAEEGRHGIVAGPESGVTSIDELAGVPVGTSLGTHQEYCVDMLFAEAGIGGEDVVKEEVKKVPIRYDLLTQGQLAAAALPEPWLTLAEYHGGTLVASDTECDNISQVFVFAHDDWLATEEGSEAMVRLLDVLSEAADLINEDPDAWRSTLVERAGVPEEIESVFVMDTYPQPVLPTEEMLDAQIDWMLDRGLIEEPVAYEDLVWEPES